MKTFFQPGVKRTNQSSPDTDPKKLRVTAAVQVLNKAVKEDMTSKKFQGKEDSQENEDSDHDELLEKVFGVSRGRPESDRK